MWCFRVMRLLVDSNINLLIPKSQRKTDQIMGWWMLLECPQLEPCVTSLFRLSPKNFTTQCWFPRPQVLSCPLATCDRWSRLLLGAGEREHAARLHLRSVVTLRENNRPCRCCCCDHISRKHCPVARWRLSDRQRWWWERDWPGIPCKPAPSKWSLICKLVPRPLTTQTCGTRAGQQWKRAILSELNFKSSQF